jgi:hypothetical protein
MAIACPKCSATEASLERRTEHLESGTVLQVVRCLVCSFRIERVVLPPAHVATARPADHQNMSRTAPAKAVKPRILPCTYPGCSGTYHTNKIIHHLCKEHRKPLQDWLHHKRKFPASTIEPPYTRINGVWVKRSEPLPGIPAEVATPDKPAGRKVTRRSKWHARCGGCKTMQNIVAWGLCLDCLEADRLKQKGARHA